MYLVVMISRLQVNICSAFSQYCHMNFYILVWLVVCGSVLNAAKYV